MFFPPSRPLVKWRRPDATLRYREIEVVPIAGSGTITMRKICREVIAKHGLTEAEFRSKRRTKKIVRARWEAIWRCSKETPNSLSAIGRTVANLDHTTVLHALRGYARMLAAQEAGE